MNIEERRALNRLSERCRKRSLAFRVRVLPNGFRVELRARTRDGQGAPFTGTPKASTHIYPTRITAVTTASRLVRDLWPPGRPGAPRGNRNAAGWPAKKAARLAQEYASI